MGNSGKTMGLLRPWWAWALAFAWLAVLPVLVFWQATDAGRVLMTTDDNVGLLSTLQRGFPSSWAGRWLDNLLLGVCDTVACSWTNVLLYALPVELFANWIHALDLWVASLFVALFCLNRRQALLSAVFAASVVAWLGTNCTLVYAGHNGKFSVLLFASMALWGIERSVSTRSSAWAMLTGGALGVMIMEQQDVAAFFGVFLGAYAVFRAWGSRTPPVWRSWAPLILMGLVAVSIAGPGALRVYFSNVGSAAVSTGEDQAQAKWEFCTQWSVPPDETIDLIAPNYFGIRSGESEGPYWGRTGQSAGWEQTHQGFMNFRLESIYIGAIPIVLALFAVAWAVWGGRGGRWEVGGGSQKTVNCKQWTVNSGGKAGVEPVPPEPRTLNPDLRLPTSDRRAEILFWGAAALIALLLSYGKYFPLYALFYQLPMVNAIRNPNKFIPVFQLCLGILAAYGLDTALRGKSEDQTRQKPSVSPCKPENIMCKVKTYPQLIAIH